MVPIFHSMFGAPATEGRLLGQVRDLLVMRKTSRVRENHAEDFLFMTVPSRLQISKKRRRVDANGCRARKVNAILTANGSVRSCHSGHPDVEIASEIEKRSSWEGKCVRDKSSVLGFTAGQLVDLATYERVGQRRVAPDDRIGK